MLLGRFLLYRRFGCGSLEVSETGRGCEHVGTNWTTQRVFFCFVLLCRVTYKGCLCDVFEQPSSETFVIMFTRVGSEDMWRLSLKLHGDLQSFWKSSNTVSLRSWSLLGLLHRPSFSDKVRGPFAREKRTLLLVASTNSTQLIE